MIGERIGDRYVVLDSIGGGGMANVYLALDVILDRHVAVKVLQPQFSKDEQFIKRFRREAQAATSLTNPHIVNIFDVGEEEDLYYIVMEYVKGRTLKEVIQEDGPLDVATALDYFKQILHGVGHAHAMQIVHRDMKPQNILISEDGEAKVTDFGIARAMTSTTITHTNSVMGSVHYLSPEQARGGHVTYRSDLYSLGIVLFEMVTGKIPFSGDTAVSIAIKHLQNEIPSARELVPSIPQSVEDIIKKATMKDPNLRFNAAEDVIWACDVALDPNQEAPILTGDQGEDHDQTKELPLVAGFATSEDEEKTIEIPAQVEDKPEEETEEEEQKKSATPVGKTKKKKKWLWASIIGLLVLIGSLILVFTVWSEVFFVEETNIPDVVGMEEADAIAEIEENQLEASTEPISSEDYEPGQVANQSPRAGRTVKEGSEVTLYIVASREEVTLDDYSGYTFSQAERLLDQLGFSVEEQAREDNSAQEGTVISQSPSSGSSVVPADTTIVLTVAVPETIQLDDLVNQTEEDVRAYFNTEGLRGTFEREHDEDIPEGRVIRQSPEPLTSMNQGGRVEIVLSRGPEPSEPDETEDVPQQPEGEVEDPVDADPVEDPADEEEPSSVYRVTQTVVVSEEHLAQERSFDVRIVATDANSQGDERVVIEETISDTTEFTIDLRVSPSYPGSYEVYIDGEFNRESDVYEYEDDE